MINVTPFWVDWNEKKRKRKEKKSRKQKRVTNAMINPYYDLYKYMKSFTHKIRGKIFFTLNS